MFEEHELLILILGIGMFIYALLKKSELVSIPCSGIIITAYLLLLTSWLFSVLEGFFYPNLLNIIEHTTGTAGSMLLALWAWLALAGKSTRS